MSPISLVGLRQVALAHCCARAPSEPCMRIPTHTAQASPNSGAGDSAPFFLMTPLIVRRWQVECTRRIQVSSGVSGSTETARCTAGAKVQDLPPDLRGRSPMQRPCRPFRALQESRTRAYLPGLSAAEAPGHLPARRLLGVHLQRSTLILAVGGAGSRHAHLLIISGLALPSTWWSAAAYLGCNERQVAAGAAAPDSPVGCRLPLAGYAAAGLWLFTAVVVGVIVGLGRGIS